MKFRIQLFLIISRTDPKIEKNHVWLVQLIRISEKFCVEWARFQAILIFSIFRSSGHPPKIILPPNKKFGIRSRDMKWIVVPSLCWEIAGKISVWLVSISLKLVLTSPSYGGSKKKTLTKRASRKVSQPWYSKAHGPRPKAQGPRPTW